MEGIRRPEYELDSEEEDQTANDTSPPGLRMIPGADSSNTSSISDESDDGLFEQLIKQYDACKRQKTYHAKQTKIYIKKMRDIKA